MSQLALSEFQAKLSVMIDGRSTAEIVKEARGKLSEKIELITPLLVDLGIAKTIQKLRGKRATALNSDGVDLFEGFALPLTSKRASADTDGKASTVRTERMTKREVVNKRNELAQLPRRRQRLLAEYTRLLVEIDKYCDDDDPVVVGLQRARDAR